MITGRLITLNGRYYAVLNLKHTDGSRWQKRINLQIPLQNNKRRAEKMLQDLQIEYTRKQMIQNNCGEMLVNDFMEAWLERKYTKLSPTTYKGYHYIICGYFKPAFEGVRLRDVLAPDLENYFQELTNRQISSTTQQHHYMLLRQVFAQAVRMELLEHNPIIGIEKPKRTLPKIDCYTAEEAQKLWELSTGTEIELLVKLTLFLGLRRSEVLGLKWTDIDFRQNTISICRAVVTAWQDGKVIVIEKDKLKNRSCNRTMPISQEIRNLLVEKKSQLGEVHSPYICTGIKGKPIHPDEATRIFSSFLKANQLRHIKLHGLRHTCASLLLSQRVPLIEVQQWLGHTTMLTTANLYGHLDFAIKIPNSETLSRILTIEEGGLYDKTL